jgi:crotonobetainyl-CoA:carnitine CoA-transferase CaiB-like acyl-CoA transferase
VADPVCAPEVGQHTVEVIREILGYDEDHLARLSEAGAFGDQPRSRAPAEVKS